MFIKITAVFMINFLFKNYLTLFSVWMIETDTFHHLHIKNKELFSVILGLE